MAKYSRLLLSEGGGIIEAAQQAEQDNCAVLCIGLGGTGISCLRNLKSKMYNRLMPDDPKSSVPGYAHIKFLAVDSDKSSPESRKTEQAFGGIDKSTEFFDIAPNIDLSSVFKNAGRTLSDSPYYREWLQYDRIHASGVKAGAGGIRQMGRYLLMTKAGEFVQKVENLIIEAKTGLVAPTVNIQIFSGISGGTGAGTFLDVCYLVRYALELSHIDACIGGYFFLPDVNLSVKEVPATKRTAIMENGYASLQELDYCMSFQTNGDEWHQQYKGPGGTITVRSKLPPVDLCHLISATTAEGDIVPNAYNYAMNVVTDYVMDFMEKPVPDSEGEKFDFTQQRSNFNDDVDHVPQDTGSTYRYLILGSSCAVVPYTRMLTYLASHFFEKLAALPKRVPTDDESKAFSAALGLSSLDELCRKVSGNASFDFISPDAKAKDVKKDKATGLVVLPYENQKTNAMKTITQNINDLGKGIEGYGPSASGTAGATPSIAYNVLQKVRGIASDANRGVFYAAELINGSKGKDLISVCRGLQAAADEKRDFYHKNQVRKSGEEEESLKAFLTSNFFTEGKTFKAWEDDVRQLNQFQAQEDMYGQVIVLLDVVIAQLKDISKKLLEPFRTVVNDLLVTFDSNAAELALNPDGNNEYEVSLIKLDDVRDLLDATLSKIDPVTEGTKLFTELLTEDGMKTWVNGVDENLLCLLVSRQFRVMFNSIAIQSIDDFLKVKYGFSNPTKLAEAVYSDLLDSINKKATPLFKRTATYGLTTMSMTGFATFPKGGGVLSLAFGKLRAAHPELAERVAEVQDRLSLIRCTIGVPMWAYSGVGQYEAPSMGALHPGQHLYEHVNEKGHCPALAPRDWASALPSPIPFCHMNEDLNSSVLMKKARTAQALYERAEARGVIVHNSEKHESFINVLDDAFVSEFRKIYAEASHGTDKKKQEAKSSLMGLREAKQYADAIELPQDTSDDSKTCNNMRYDFFAKSPIYQYRVDEQMKILDELDQDIENLTPKAKEVDADVVQLFEALACGIVKARGKFIAYQDEYMQDYMLSKPSMEFSATRLYQALVTYRDDLDQSVKEQIVNQTAEIKETLDNCGDGYDAAHAQAEAGCSFLEGELDDKMLAASKSVSKDSYPNEMTALVDMYESMRILLKSFMRSYI